VQFDLQYLLVVTEIMKFGMEIMNMPTNSARNFFSKSAITKCFDGV